MVRIMWTFVGFFHHLVLFFRSSQDQPIVLKTWERAKERELAIVTTPNPKNLFEEMITMTEKGILWNFPIDNEQGLEKVSCLHPIQWVLCWTLGGLRMLAY